MCIHENTQSPKFRTLAIAIAAMSGMVPVTLVDGHGEFSMFVNPHSPTCVRRVTHDLKTWHPDTRGRGAFSYGFSEQTAERLGMDWWDLRELEPNEGRDVPDSLDMEETDHRSVLVRCIENGYLHEDDYFGRYVGQYMRQHPDSTLVTAEAAARITLSNLEEKFTDVRLTGATVTAIEPDEPKPAEDSLREFFLSLSTSERGVVQAFVRKIADALQHDNHNDPYQEFEMRLRQAVAQIEEPVAREIDEAEAA